MRILIVEDETALAEGLEFNFQQEGYHVDLTGDGPTALQRLDDADPPIAGNERIRDLPANP